MRNTLLSKEYRRFVKDRSDAGYERAIAEIQAEQAGKNEPVDKERLVEVVAEVIAEKMKPGRKPVTKKITN